MTPGSAFIAANGRRSASRQRRISRRSVRRLSNLATTRGSVAAWRAPGGGRRSSASWGLLVCAVVALPPVPGKGDQAANHVGGQPGGARDVPERRSEER